MKNFKIYLITLSILFAFASCDDSIIELTERDRLPTAVAVADISGLEFSMLAVYTTAKNIHENGDISMYKQCGTDIIRSGTHLTDVAAGGMLGMQEYTAGLAPTSDQINTLFNGLYLSIDLCNVVIQFGGNFEPKNADEEARLKYVIGEAHTLRAYLYLELVQRWDNVVLYLKLLEAGEPIDYNPELATPAETYAQIISDCEAAIPLLEDRGSSAGVGAPSSGMANLILAKAHMDLGNWAEAAAAADEVVLNSGYELQPLDGIFGLSGGKTGEESNKELIFSWVWDQGITTSKNRTVQMMVPLYDRVPGVARTLAQGARPWSRLSPSDYYWTLFEEGDERVNAWHINSWVVDDPENIDTTFGTIEEGDLLTSESPYFLAWASNDREIRYLDRTSTKNWEDDTYGRTEAEAEGFRNVIVFRLAEAYMIGAEAHWRAGNEGRGLELINVLRERAFGDSSHNFASLDQETILEEYARELGHEGHRWAMLKRLGLLVERVQMYNPEASGNIDAHHVRWPIPQTFVDLTQVPQNPGY